MGEEVWVLRGVGVGNRQWAMGKRETGDGRREMYPPLAGVDGRAMGKRQR